MSQVILTINKVLTALQMLFIYGDVPSSLNLLTNKCSVTDNTCFRCQRCTPWSHTENQAFRKPRGRIHFHLFIMSMYHIDLFPNDPLLEMNFFCTVHNNYRSISLSLHQSYLCIWIRCIYASYHQMIKDQFNGVRLFLIGQRAQSL